MLKNKIFYILILQISIFCTVNAKSPNLKESVDSASKIKGYNISGIIYDEEDDKSTSKFKNDDCEISIESDLKKGVLKRTIKVAGPSNVVTKKCFQDLNKNVLAKSFSEKEKNLIAKQADLISNDYTFSYFKEESVFGNLKANEGNINFILYDCPLDSGMCENLHDEMMNY